MKETLLLAVNGTLMRGLALENNLKEETHSLLKKVKQSLYIAYFQ